MNKKLIIFLIAIVVIFVWAKFYGSNKVTNYPSSGVNIVAFGDSLVQGVGSTEGNDFVSALSREVGVPIINAGISGNTTADGLERLERDVLSKDPKVVLVLLGGNDYLRRIDKIETFSNLQKIVDAIHKRGAIVLLLGVRGGLLRDTYKEDFDEFAGRNNVAYVPNVLDGILTKKEFMSDQIHPNDKGYKVIAEKIAPELSKLIK